MSTNYLNMSGWGGLDRSLLGSPNGTAMLDPSQLNRFQDWSQFSSNPAIAGLGGVQPAAPVNNSWLSRGAIFGDADSAGWAPTLLGFGQAALGFANSRAQNRLAKANFNRYVGESNLNIENQAKGINESLQTRQERRVRERFGNLSEAEQAGKVADYMAKWGVKDKVQG